MAGLVGSSNSPYPAYICTILFASLILALLMGPMPRLDPCDDHDRGGCVLRSIAGDNLQDLKCGYFDRRIAWRQQLMLASARSQRAFNGAVLNLCCRPTGWARDERPSAIAAGGAGDVMRRCRAACLRQYLEPW